VAIQIRVQALGAPSVMIEGKVVNAWDGITIENVFYFMVDGCLQEYESARNTGFRTLDDFAASIWGNTPIQEAETNLERVRERVAWKIGNEAAWKNPQSRSQDPRLIIDVDHRFFLGTGVEVIYDVKAFEDAYRIARYTENLHADQAWTSALHLYSGPYLHGTQITSPWVRQRREELENMHQVILRHLEWLGF